MICVWLGGGPPHIDMFDMKPDAPAEYRGEFKPIQTNVPGLQICELMPGLAKLADKYTIIRSVTTMNKPGDHARRPFYWLTGNPRLPSGTDEYPMYGSAVVEVPARPRRPADLRHARHDRRSHASTPSRRASSARPTARSSSTRAKSKRRHQPRC